MSRYTVTVTKGSNVDREATIGYDMALQTFFLQALYHPETDVPEIELGRVTRRFDSLESMLELARREGYEVTGLTQREIVQLTKQAAAAGDPRNDFLVLLGREVARMLKIIVQRGVNGWGYDPEETGNRNLDTMPGRSGFATADEAYRDLGCKAHSIALGDLERGAIDASYLPDIDRAYEMALLKIIS
jgi:hypothetical protein